MKLYPIFILLIFVVCIVLIGGCTSPSVHNVTYRFVDQNGAPLVNAIINISSQPGIYQNIHTLDNGEVIIRSSSYTVYSLQISNLSNGLTYNFPNLVFPDTDTEYLQTIDLIRETPTSTQTPISTPTPDTRPDYCKPSPGLWFAHAVADPILGCK